MHEVLAAVEAGDVDRTLRACAAVPRRDVPSVFPLVNAEWERIGTWHVEEAHHRHTRLGSDAQCLACRVALTALASARDLPGVPHDDLPLAEIIHRAAPPWAEQVPSVRDQLTPRVQLTLAALGLCDLPTDDDAVEAFVEGLGFRSDIPLVDVLRPALDAMRPVLFRMFEVEGGPQSSPAAADKYRAEENQWGTVFLTLVDEGLLPRDRVLDCCLDALGRDFAAFRAGWYRRLHDALKPDKAEKARRAAAYVNLLGSSIPTTVSFAVKEIDRLAKAARVDADAVLDALGPVMVARQKGTVKQALKLALRLADAPERVDRALDPAFDALLHDAADVQAAALDAIEDLTSRASDPAGVTARLSEVRDLVAPSLRARLPGQDVPEDAPAEALPEPEAEPILALPLPATLEETVQLLVEALEETNPLLHECAWHGMVTHPAPDAKHVGPVRKRARALEKRAVHWDAPLRGELARLVLAWCGDEIPARPVEHGAVDRVWQGFIAELLARVTSPDARPLLCTPTHHGGWIDPEAMARRSTEGVGPFEAVLALQRLPAEHRPDLLSRLPDLDADALALAADPPHRTWTFLVRTEDSQGQTFYRVEPTPTPDASFRAPALRIREICASRPPADWRLGRPDLVAWLATTTPDDAAWLFAAGARELGIELADGSALPWQLYRLADGPALGEPFHVFLALALGLKAKGAAMAVDAFLDTLAGGVLDVEALGSAWADLMPAGVLSCKRVAAAVGPLLHEPAARVPLARAMTRALRGEVEGWPKDLGAWLGVLVELHALDAVTLDDEARAFLEGCSRGGAVKKHRKVLLG